MNLKPTLQSITHMRCLSPSQQISSQTIDLERLDANTVLSELKTFIRSSTFVLSRHLVAPDIYDRFKRVIDDLAMERKRDYFYPNSVFSKSISVKPDIVVGFVNKTLNELNIFYKNNVYELRESRLSQFTGLSTIYYLINNEIIFRTRVSNLFPLITEIYETSSASVSPEAKDALTIEIINLVTIFAEVVREFLYIISSPKGIASDFVNMYDSIILKFMLSSAIVLSNILGHWCDQVLRKRKTNFIDAEFVVVLISIGCMMAYLLECYINGEGLVTVRKMVSENILNNFANTIDILNNIVSICSANVTCIRNTLREAYENPLEFSCLDVLMSLLPK